MSKIIFKKTFLLSIIIINIIGIFSIVPTKATNTYTIRNTKKKDRLELIRERGVLWVCSSNDIPISFTDPKTNEFSGIDADILKEVAKRIGINKVEIKSVTPFSNLIDCLNTNADIDIIANGMYVTEDRKKEVLFTNIWYKESEAVLIPKVSRINSKEDLKNEVIGALEGTSFLELAENWKKDNLVKDVVIYNDQNTLLCAVNEGKINAAITDSIVSTYLLSKDSKLYLKILSPYEPETLGKIAAAVRKSDISLAKAINKEIDNMKKDKTLMEILDKYGLDESYFVPIKESDAYATFYR